MSCFVFSSGVFIGVSLCEMQQRVKHVLRGESKKARERGRGEKIVRYPQPHAMTVLYMDSSCQ